LVAAVDTDELKLRDFADAHGVRSVYSDYREMLERERPDIVSICTWPQLHGEMTLTCADAGLKGILCEKPMALTLADVDLMIEACERRRVKLATCHELRFIAHHIQAKELIDAGEMGRVYWMRGIRLGGDLITNAIHTVDLMRHFMDDEPIRWVFGQIDARSGRVAYGHPTEDSSIGYMEFGNGVRAFLETGAFTKLGNHHIYVEGTEGRLEINPKGLHTLEGPHLRVQRRGQGLLEELTFDNRDHNEISVTGVIQALVAWIEGRPESPTSARNARASQEATMAILESARRGEVVILPLEPTTEFPMQRIVREGRVPRPSASG